MKKLMSTLLILGFFLATAATVEAHGRRHHYHGHRHYRHYHHQHVYQPYYYHMRQHHRHFHGCGHAGYGNAYLPYPYYNQNPGFSIHVGY